jgi:3-phenylpropionate/trans-cinnamate dioxygenase ferredoxin subunit
VTQSRHDVGALADFAEDSLTKVTVEGQDVVVIRQGGEVYAVPDRCTHAKYPLHDGELLDGKIKCVHHGATFDLHSGRPTLPAVKRLRLFDAEIEDGRVVVTLQQA